ncbi:MAG: hypothetical protein GY696_22315 [Gammaproteobacteria bacterium]|nr:hypothetical protein [Gammaproteobacteria bacterium]
MQRNVGCPELRGLKSCPEFDAVTRRLVKLRARRMLLMEACRGAIKSYESLVSTLVGLFNYNMCAIYV